MRRFVYLLYYIINTSPAKLFKFARFSAKDSGRTMVSIFADMVVSSVRYNISLLDYFYFLFYKLDHSERIKWAGTGTMFEYQSLMNPRPAREFLIDKIKFLDCYSAFLKRAHFIASEILSGNKVLSDLLNNESGRLVLKGSRGQAGSDVRIVNCKDIDSISLYNFMKRNHFDLIEEYINQHESFLALSPSGVNTVRIITQVVDNSVDILAARIRVSVNSDVDNMAAGNLAANIDIVSGIVDGPGVYSDITKEDQIFHPVTGVSITGFKIPFWKETIDLAREAALLFPQNKSVGWDIAITENGPELIEGNHNWCKLLWQLPVKKGLKYELEKYL
jgi:hypothetical protein